MFRLLTADSAISQLQAGAIDMYSYGLASDAFPAIKEAGLPYAQSMGGSYSIISLTPLSLLTRQD